ncbi:MAG: fructose-1,6-bisphosphatase [Clostridiales bacterium]|nr:fructose-1,6-bisphosphatase [Candidatus Apopatocola equi]MCQ2438469.1 fructose-1,6-bisphosphatase [Oscillospiraceae bacterium]
MTREELKYLELLSKDFPSIAETAAEIVRQTAILQLPKTTEHFMSDIHGEYDYFTHILQNASGAVHRKIDECFGYSLSNDEKNALALLIYYPEREIARGPRTPDWYRKALSQLVNVSRESADKYTRAKMRTRMPTEYSYIIEELINTQEFDDSKQSYFRSILDTVIDTGIADDFIVALANFISRVTVDRLHIVGDMFDRGSAAERVISELMQRKRVDFVWGNHDVLWMGAGMGNPACVANALRNSVKYGNFDTLEDGYGINVRPLAIFAVEQYADDPCLAFVPSRVTDCVTENAETNAKILKAISVIQFKLEGQLVMRHPEYHMEDRLLLDKMDRETGVLQVGDRVWHSLDVALPTVDPADPYKLSPAEQEVIELLCSSFARSDKLQEHVRYLMENGAMYRECNGNLLYHGCVPMNPDGSFKQVSFGGKTYSGKALFDYCEQNCRKAMYDRRLENTDFLWYLWCGPSSPLNGKDKIATFERSFLQEEEAGEEAKDPYYDLWDDPATADAILAEFGVDGKYTHIINGHVPVKKRKGEEPIKAGGKFINIDGGISKAYQPVTGICGFTLVSNSQMLYLAEHQPFDPNKVTSTSEDMFSRITTVEQYPEQLLVMDTDGGEEILGRVADLRRLLDAYRTGLIKPPVEED